MLTIQPMPVSSIANQNSPSSVSSQNSTSGDHNSSYNRNQQQQKRKSIRNSIGRLFARKSDFIDAKPMCENTQSTIYITHG